LGRRLVEVEEGFLVIKAAARLLRVFEVAGTEATRVSLLQLKTSLCWAEVTYLIWVH